MTFVCCVPSGAEWWVLPGKGRVVTQAESELHGEHIARALEKLPVSHLSSRQRHQELPLAAARRELWGWGLELGITWQKGDFTSLW